MARRVLCPVCSESSVTHPEIRCANGCAPVRIYGESRATGLERFKLAVRMISSELNTSWGSDEYLAATGHGVSSSVIQAHVERAIVSLGFNKERRNRIGLAGFVPDFTDADEKVMVEVERGKTIDNNMDMLDMWKCHVHPTASHLILVVPVWYQTGKDHPKVKGATFAKVCNRIGLFFEPQNLTNVAATAVIGY